LATTIQIRSKGVITLPIELRRRYGLSEGHVLSLIDLGDGSFVITPRLLQINRLGDKVAEALAGAGVTVEEVLRALDEERESYYRENYAKG